MDQELIAYLDGRFSNIEERFHETSQQIAGLREETTQQITSLREETSQQITSLREETTQQITSLREETTQNFGRVDEKIRQVHVVVEGLRNEIHLVAERGDRSRRAAERLQDGCRARVRRHSRFGPFYLYRVGPPHPSIEEA
jgi:archaellum component FlaC